MAGARIAECRAELDRVDAQKRAHHLPTNDVVLVITDVTRISRTWCVFYDNLSHIETGSISAALAGNGPVLVSDDGVVGVAGTAHPVDRYVAEFEESVSS